MSLLSEDAAAGSADGKVAKMSELNTDKKYMKPEIEQETLKGTGLLLEEHKVGRNSLAGKKMRDLVVDPEMQECITPREEAQKKGALAMTGLEHVSLEQAAPQKGVANTAHLGMSLTKAAWSDEQIKATNRASLSPEWHDAIVYMRLVLTMLGTSAKLRDETPPVEAYAKVVAACRKTAKKPELPTTKHESATSGLLEKRKKVQRGCQSLVFPYSEFEVPGAFNQRLEAMKRLSALREGPHVVPVLPMGQGETPAQARMRLETQARCCTAILPVTQHENADAYEERLDACRLLPTKMKPMKRSSSDGAAGAGGGQERPLQWPLLPKGKHESGASFTLRLEVAAKGTSVPVLPQSHGEGDAEAARRFKAQQAAPHTMLWPYHPQLESLEAFEQRCAELMPAAKQRTEKRRGSAVGRRMSAMLSSRRESRSQRDNSSDSSGKFSERGSKERRRSLIMDGMSRLSMTKRGAPKAATSPGGAPKPKPKLEVVQSVDQMVEASDSQGQTKPRQVPLKKGTSNPTLTLGGRPLAPPSAGKKKKRGFFSRLFGFGRKPKNELPAAAPWERAGP